MKKMITLLLLIFTTLLNLSSAQTTTLNGKQYLMTSLSASGTSDPYELAVKYGHGNDWLNIYLYRNSKYVKMTSSLSESIDNDETLLVPLEWTGTSPSNPPPSSTPKTPSTPPPSTPPPSTPPPSSTPSGSWKKAIATYYESYPTTAEESDSFSGDKYKGMFAFYDDQKTESWVQSHSLCAIAENSWNSLKGKTIKISLYSDGRNPFDVQVVDFCSDSDCDGCCSSNMNSAGVNFLIDLEKYTAAKFLGKSPSAVVQDSLYQVIYYSTSSAASANEDADSQLDSKSGLSPLYIGLIVGGAVLVVIVIIIVALLGRKSSQERV